MTENINAESEQKASTMNRDENKSCYAINKLVTEIKDIQNKAETSEKMVTEICKDIQELDYAKHNVTNTINVISRLRTLRNLTLNLTIT